MGQAGQTPQETPTVLSISLEWRVGTEHLGLKGVENSKWGTLPFGYISSAFFSFFTIQVKV